MADPVKPPPSPWDMPTVTPAPAPTGTYVTPSPSPTAVQRTPPPLSSAGPYNSAVARNAPYNVGGSFQRPNFGTAQMPVSLGPTDAQGIVHAAGEQARWGQYGPEGLNMMTPGYGEQFFRQTVDQYGQPLAGEAWWQQNQDKFGQPGMGAQYISGALGQGAQLPSADMGAYYENAKRRAAEGINAEMAARGAWGSSAATDRVSEAFTDLEAQRAMDEAQYGLKRSELGRGWTQTLGQLGLGADEQKLYGLLGAGKLSQSAGSDALERLIAGQRAATGAQQSMEGRGQSYLDNQFREANTLGGIAGQGYDDIITGDQALLEAELAARMGMSSDQLAAAYRQQAEGRQDMGDYMSWLTNLYKTGKELKS
jgi:hypothetical protein